MKDFVIFVWVKVLGVEKYFLEIFLRKYVKNFYDVFILICVVSLGLDVVL